MRPFIVEPSPTVSRRCDRIRTDATGKARFYPPWRQDLRPETGGNDERTAEISCGDFSGWHRIAVARAFVARLRRDFVRPPPSPRRATASRTTGTDPARTGFRDAFGPPFSPPLALPRRAGNQDMGPSFPCATLSCTGEARCAGPDAPPFGAPAYLDSIAPAGRAPSDRSSGQRPTSGSRRIVFEPPPPGGRLQRGRPPSGLPWRPAGATSEDGPMNTQDRRFLHGALSRGKQHRLVPAQRPELPVGVVPPLRRDLRVAVRGAQGHAHSPGPDGGESSNRRSPSCSPPPGAAGSPASSSRSGSTREPRLPPIRALGVLPVEPLTLGHQAFLALPFRDAFEALRALLPDLVSLSARAQSNSFQSRSCRCVPCRFPCVTCSVPSPPWCVAVRPSWWGSSAPPYPTHGLSRGALRACRASWPAPARRCAPSAPTALPP